MIKPPRKPLKSTLSFQFQPNFQVQSKKAQADASTLQKAFLALLLLAGLHLMLMIGVEARRYMRGEQKLNELHQSIEQLQRNIFEQEAIAQHQGDARYMESLARAQGFIYPNESRIITQKGSSSFANKP